MSNNHVYGKLVPSGGGDTIPLVRASLTVGRRESCDVCLRFPNVSGVHCEFVHRDGYWYVHDLHSTNGVKVNGLRVQQKLLHPGDEVAIANLRYTIYYELPADRRALEEVVEEDIISRPLLEKAGLACLWDHEERRHNLFSTAFTLRDEDE